MPAYILRSVLQCPHCGFKPTQTMPADCCVVRLDCEACGQRITPKAGDCCVFCSYGTVKCPPKQAES